jgi:uncharacterized phage protein gp47/JayE
VAYSESETTILTRMIGNVPSDIDTTEGSLVYDALSPTADEIAQMEVELDEVLKKAFASTAEENGYSDELELRAAEFGIDRKDGTAATAVCTFTGTDGTYTGVTVQTTAGLQYTTGSVTISSGTGTATVTAAAVGTSYNVPSATIIGYPVQISGLTAVTNAAAATGGTAEETDAALLARLLLKVQTPATSGNANQYKEWALEISGIGGAKVFPLWDGNGTVKICVIDSNKEAASTELVTAVETYIEEERPIGSTVTYESATALNINVAATLTVASGYTVVGVTANVEAAITAYLKSVAFTNNLSESTQQDYISYAKIGEAIIDVPGVTDYSGLLVNSGTANVTVGAEEVAILGTVTLS